MIRKQQDIMKEVDGKLTTIGTVYMKKHRVVVELGGYKFKTAHVTDKRALDDQYIVILFFLNLDNPLGDCTLFFCDENGTAVVSPDLVVTSSDLGWEDGTHTLKDLYTYYKETAKCKLV